MNETLDMIDFAGRVVLGIWAHPDDEAYLSAGLMARVARTGGRMVCLHATLGERGTDDPVTWPPDRLAAHRRRELDTSLSGLGVQQHTVLGYPDGGCTDVDPAEAIMHVDRLIEQEGPDMIVTFAPDGLTGHPDHIAVSGWVTSAWGQRPWGRLLYATNTESFMARHRRLHERTGVFGDDAPFVTDDRVAAKIVLTRTELDLKRRALAAHGSQTAGLAALMGEDEYRHWYDIESFRRPTATEIASARRAVAV